MLSLKVLFKGLYKLCACGCDKLLLIVSKQGYIRNFINGHYIRTVNQIGEKNAYWKGGRSKDEYWFLYMPDYYRSDKRGYIQEHIYIYEQHHKLCMLPWGDVHHIDFNKENNEVSNLQGMMKGKHSSIHKLGKLKDTSDRRCFDCGTDKTTIYKPSGTHRTPYPIWCHLPWDKINWYCHKCYYTKYYR